MFVPRLIAMMPAFSTGDFEDIIARMQAVPRLVEQTVWEHGKSARCAPCGLAKICAGLNKMDVYYKSDELCPVFCDVDAIIKKIKAG